MTDSSHARGLHLASAVRPAEEERIASVERARGSTDGSEIRSLRALTRTMPLGVSVVAALALGRMHGTLR